MRLSAEDLNQIKIIFDASVLELLKRDDFCEKIAKIVSNEVTTLKESMTRLEQENQLLKKKLDDVEQYTRRNNVRVFGIPEEENENVENSVLKVFQEKMGVAVQPESMERCHRLGRRDDRNRGPRPIIVKFMSYKHREAVFNMKRRLKGSKIVVSEDLTSYNYNILKYAKEKCGKNKAWSYDGKIYISHNNAKVLIKSVTDLDVIVVQ